MIDICSLGTMMKYHLENGVGKDILIANEVMELSKSELDMDIFWFTDREAAQKTEKEREYEYGTHNRN